ncbi:division/cell wall cluster transcriptional repressor MraZ [Lactobacillus sp. S2-2]|uniref:division/cell wall cluster transcriptional repressor MraZ n=1 Tax=Lactobacillus sp. S2-2 TaxID=2692917 RepID=UPI001F02B430|nr:division/cell wall cluster transcriptional repressor MraZ [Lactobacillus sp. S2-2]MCF6514849.1 division/cell wall cluster transcriptional repressor MraZ [Lactobacillus sp. S2-2]
MLIGEYRHNIDSKGRLIVPAKFRNILGDNLIVTRGLDGCLFGYSLDQWQKIQTKIEELPVNRKDARTFTRFFFSAATDCDFDKQGRINLPDLLINYAGLNKKCVLVGLSDRVEIWSEEKWNSFTEETESKFEDIAEDLLDL